MHDFIYTPPLNPYLEILYCDEDLIVINKPHGLLSVPGRPLEHFDSALSRVKELFPKAAAVHRLDMDTSGLLIIALNKKANQALASLFEKKLVKKYYLALIEGQIEKEGVIQYPLRCDLENRPLQIVDFNFGKKAKTKFLRIDEFDSEYKSSSLVLLEPITGRSHQLRVHLQKINHPILGDRFYNQEFKKASRLCLHAFYLKFTHPFTGDELQFTSCPDFLNKIPLEATMALD